MASSRAIVVKVGESYPAPRENQIGVRKEDSRWIIDGVAYEVDANYRPLGRRVHRSDNGLSATFVVDNVERDRVTVYVEPVSEVRILNPGTTQVSLSVPAAYRRDAYDNRVDWMVISLNAEQRVQRLRTWAHMREDAAELLVYAIRAVDDLTGKRQRVTFDAVYEWIEAAGGEKRTRVLQSAERVLSLLYMLDVDSAGRNRRAIPVDGRTLYLDPLRSLDVFESPTRALARVPTQFARAVLLIHYLETPVAGDSLPAEVTFFGATDDSEASTSFLLDITAYTRPTQTVQLPVTGERASGSGGADLLVVAIRGTSTGIPSANITPVGLFEIHVLPSYVFSAKPGFELRAPSVVDAPAHDLLSSHLLPGATAWSDYNTGYTGSHWYFLPGRTYLSALSVFHARSDIHNAGLPLGQSIGQSEAFVVPVEAKRRRGVYLLMREYEADPFLAALVGPADTANAIQLSSKNKDSFSGSVALKTTGAPTYYYRPRRVAAAFIVTDAGAGDHNPLPRSVAQPTYEQRTLRQDAHDADTRTLREFASLIEDVHQTPVLASVDESTGARINLIKLANVRQTDLRLVPLPLDKTYHSVPTKRSDLSLAEYVLKARERTYEYYMSTNEILAAVARGPEQPTEVSFAADVLHRAIIANLDGKLLAQAFVTWLFAANETGASMTYTELGNTVHFLGLITTAEQMDSTRMPLFTTTDVLKDVAAAMAQVGLQSPGLTRTADPPLLDRVPLVPFASAVRSAIAQYSGDKRTRKTALRVVQSLERKLAQLEFAHQTFRDVPAINYALTFDAVRAEAIIAVNAKRLSDEQMEFLRTFRRVPLSVNTAIAMSEFKGGDSERVTAVVTPSTVPARPAPPASALPSRTSGTRSTTPGWAFDMAEPLATTMIDVFGGGLEAQWSFKLFNSGLYQVLRQLPADRSRSATFNEPVSRDYLARFRVLDDMPLAPALVAAISAPRRAVAARLLPAASAPVVVAAPAPRTSAITGLDQLGLVPTELDAQLARSTVRDLDTIPGGAAFAQALESIRSPVKPPPSPQPAAPLLVSAASLPARVDTELRTRLGADATKPLAVANIAAAPRELLGVVDSDLFDVLRQLDGRLPAEASSLRALDTSVSGMALRTALGSVDTANAGLVSAALLRSADLGLPMPIVPVASLSPDTRNALVTLANAPRLSGIVSATLRRVLQK